jgi:hypothetical protein
MPMRPTASEGPGLGVGHGRTVDEISFQSTLSTKATRDVFGR